ncbi:reverse transcriptase domain-containing protein [Tanacetum coccineum]
MKLYDVIRNNLDIFAWKPADMTGVPRSIAEHRLNVHEGCAPIRQKRRGQAPDRNKAIQKEVAKLVDAKIMREVHYHSWLANPVMMAEKNCIKKNDFQWTPEAERAFWNMKQCIAELPMVTAPKPKEELIVYLCAAREAVSAVLLIERESQQMLVYFISRALQKAEKIFPSTPDSGVEFTYALRFEFNTSNNEAEYEALLAGLRIAEKMGVKNLEAKVDSHLVANQVNGSYVAKEQSMIQYLEKTKALISEFKKFSIEQVPRSENKKADALSKIASTSFAHLTKQVLVEYLTDGTLPAEAKKARAVKIKSRQYDVISGVLYRKSFLEPWLRCVGPLQAEYVIREIHEGSCSMHSGPRSVVAKAIRSGYYWPMMHKDAENIIRKCDDCQVHRLVPKNPQAEANTHNLTLAILQMRNRHLWPFPRSSREGEIVSDNGKQFRDNPFKDWCDKLNIKQRFASVKHPQTNRQMEKENRNLGEGIKAMLGGENKNWVEEVPHVLWVHRTTIKISNGHTSFSLTYGTEAVIPVEIGMPSLRCAKIDQAVNDEALLLNLDVLEEEREKAAIQEARSKVKMERYYNAKVSSTIFRRGDFVYRNNEASHAMESRKLGPKWEGPYEVVEALGRGAYMLRNSSGDTLPRTWNVKDLKRCYL